MVFGLAFYASPRGFPRHDARLASGRLSGATGRASHHQGPCERFQNASLHLVLLSQALLGAIPSTGALKGVRNQGGDMPPNGVNGSSVFVDVTACRREQLRCLSPPAE